MRIGWITYDWRTDTGGKGVSGTAFMNALDERGHEVTLIDLEMASEGTVDRSRLREGITLVPYWTGGMRGVITSFPRLLAEVRTHDLVVVGAAPNIDLVLLCALVPFRFLHRAKLVRLEFTNPRTYLNYSAFARAYDVLGKLLFPRLDLTVSPSRGVADQIVEQYGVPEEDALVVPWPCVPAGFDALIAAEVPEPLFNGRRPDILAITVMRLSLQDKDFDTLLKAFKRVHAETGAELAVLGAGDPAPIEKLIAREGLQGKVHLLGERKNPHAYVAKADLFLFASKYEGNPLVLAEAAACGCPIVATDCDFGPRELVTDGETGFLVPVRDHRRFADRAIELARDPQLRAAMASRAMKGIERYGVEAASTEFALALEGLSDGLERRIVSQGRLYWMTKPARLMRVSPYRLARIAAAKLRYRLTGQGTDLAGRLVTGQRITINAPSGTDLYLYGCKIDPSETRLTRFLIRTLKPGQTFIDIGAHLGFYTALGRRLVGEEGTVIAYEPVEETFRILERNAQAWGGVSAVNAALADKEGDGLVYNYALDHAENTSIIEGFYPGRDGVPVRLVTLDGEMRRRRLAPALIKMDAEGAESMIVAGATAAIEESHPTIAIEFGDHAVHRGIPHQLEELGYALYGIEDDGSVAPFKEASHTSYLVGMRL